MHKKCRFFLYLIMLVVKILFMVNFCINFDLNGILKLGISSKNIFRKYEKS